MKHNNPTVWRGGGHGPLAPLSGSAPVTGKDLEIYLFNLTAKLLLFKNSFINSSILPQISNVLKL